MLKIIVLVFLKVVTIASPAAAAAPQTLPRRRVGTAATGANRNIREKEDTAALQGSGNGPAALTSFTFSYRHTAAALMRRHRRMFEIIRPGLTRRVAAVFPS